MVLSSLSRFLAPFFRYIKIQISQRITTSTLDIPDADVTAGLIQVVPHGRPLIDFTIDPTRNSSDQTTTPVKTSPHSLSHSIHSILSSPHTSAVFS